MTSEAQKRAQKNYDKKRGTPVIFRFKQEEKQEFLDWLDERRKDGESRADAILRLVGFYQ
jgi:hypothetical protein